MAIVVTESAHKHGYDQDDAVNAMLNNIALLEDFEASREADLPDPSLWIGPAVDATLLEVMTYERPPETLVVFHMMPARRKFLDRI